MKTVAAAKISRVVLPSRLVRWTAAARHSKWTYKPFLLLPLNENFPSALLGKLIKLESFAEKIGSRGLSFRLREKQKV